MSRTRAGRKSWESRENFNRNVNEFFTALAAAPALKFGISQTKAMIIERIAKETGIREVLTFSQAYGELSGWTGRAFANISEDGLSDMLAETFLSGARVFTQKAEYRLWKRAH